MSMSHIYKGAVVYREGTSLSGDHADHLRENSETMVVIPMVPAQIIPSAPVGRRCVHVSSSHPGKVSVDHNEQQQRLRVTLKRMMRRTNSLSGELHLVSSGLPCSVICVRRCERTQRRRVCRLAGRQSDDVLCLCAGPYCERDEKHCILA